MYQELKDEERQAQVGGWGRSMYKGLQAECPEGTEASWETAGQWLQRTTGVAGGRQTPQSLQTMSGSDRWLE